MLLPSLSRFATLGITFFTFVFTTIVAFIAAAVGLSQKTWPISTYTMTIHPSITLFPNTCKSTTIGSVPRGALKVVCKAQATSCFQ